MAKGKSEAGAATQRPSANGSPKPEQPKPTIESVSRTIADARKQDVFLYNGPIDDHHFGSLVTNSGKKEYDQALLILCTLGGEATNPSGKYITL